METHAEGKLELTPNRAKTVSTPMLQAMEEASFIRKMFEEGHRMKQELGEDKVFDFSLGNPSAPPPDRFYSALLEVAAESRPADHRYMHNVGLEATRASVAERVSRTHGVAISADHVVMSSGAAGALNVLLKAVLEVGDEVILLVPYFTEYLFYIRNHGGVPRIVATDGDFQPDLAALESALGPRTRAVIVNTPNNPSGVCYRPESVDGIGALLDAHSDRVGRAVYLFLDEPYRRIRYGDVRHPSALHASRHGIVVTSFSKELGLAGERIGYFVLNPRHDDWRELAKAAGIATRILGFVNAPALMQRVIARLGDAGIDITPYRENRDLLAGALREAGYRMPEPEGAFFLFPQAPGGDDLAFCAKLRERGVLCVPGRGFGAPGNFRISYAVPRSVVEGAIPHFIAAIRP